MGFGLLFIGYLFSFGFTSGVNYVTGLVGILGSIFLLAASKKLSLYSKFFKAGQILSITVGLSYLINIIVQLLQSGENTPYSRLSKALIITAVFAFNLIMYLGIGDISKSVGDDKLYVSAYRDLVVMVIYYFSISLTPMLTRTVTNVAYISSLFSAVLGLVWLVVSVWLVISAYMRICLPGDENMPQK